MAKCTALMGSAVKGLTMTNNDTLYTVMLHVTFQQQTADLT